MIVTVTRLEQEVCSALEIAEETTIDILKCLIEADLNIPKNKQLLFYNNMPLKDNLMTVSNAGIKDGGVIVVRIVETTNVESNDITRMMRINQNVSSASLPFSSSSNSQKISNVDDTQTMKNNARVRAQELIDLCEKDRSIVGSLFNKNLQLAEAVKNKNIDDIAHVIFEQQSMQKKLEEERSKRLRQVLFDPLAVESQQFLEEQLRQQQLDESYHMAQEYLPETFGDVFMVYVDMEVNGFPLKAFVDSGAQATIMSKGCAERCNLIRLVDKRFQGIAQGVGTSRIVGRIHLAQLKIGNSFFPASFTVLEDDKVDFLFGLDMLRRYQSCLDFKKNVLRIGDEEVPFLSEKDLKRGIFGGLISANRSFSSIELPTKSSAISSSSTSLSSLNNTCILPPANLPASTDTSVHSSFSKNIVSKQEMEKEQVEEKKKSYRESAIKSLMELGFSREASEMAFRQAGENAELAASLLFQQF